MSVIDSKPTIEQLTFVIRSAGERTLEACEATTRAAIKSSGGTSSQLHVIAERPFSAAVRRTLEIGLECKRPFIVGMDADILLSREGIPNFLRIGAAMKPQAYSVAGLTLCRFFGGYCFRGVHIYRREHLSPALGLIGQRTPGGVDPDLKPETAVVEAMKARGFGFEAFPIPLGIHDFEQSYRHIYLKMRLRARRQMEIDYKEGDIAELLTVCDRGAGRSGGGGASDFLVARWGLEDGVADATRKLAGDASVPANYDWFAPLPEFDRRMAEVGWDEKALLNARACNGIADRAMAEHDLRGDGRTPKWIRDTLIGRAAA